MSGGGNSVRLRDLPHCFNRLLALQWTGKKRGSEVHPWVHVANTLDQPLKHLVVNKKNCKGFCSFPCAKLHQSSFIESGLMPMSVHPLSGAYNI